MDGFRPLYTPAALALAIPSSWRSRGDDELLALIRRLVAFPRRVLNRPAPLWPAMQEGEKR
jgi:hypothetical protein